MAALPPEVRDRPQGEGDELRLASRIAVVPFDPDREPWERQSAERMLYYKWFMTYMDYDTKGRERSVQDVFRRVRPNGTSQIRFREIARVWQWERRAELYDEFVFRNSRASYLRAVELMAARQARVGMVTAGMGAAVLREFTAQLRQRIEDGELSWKDALGLLPTALRAIEIGQREERLARGFQRSIAMPSPTDDDFTRVVEHLEYESGPEVDKAFRQLEEVLVERVTVRRSIEIDRPDQVALPSPHRGEPHYPDLPEYEDEGDSLPVPRKSDEATIRRQNKNWTIRSADKERAKVADGEIEVTAETLEDGSVESRYHSNTVPLLAEQQMRELRQNLPTEEEVPVTWEEIEEP